MKKIINGADNVTIAPSFVVEGVSMILFHHLFFAEFSLRQKRKATEAGLMKMEKEETAQAEKSA